MAALVPPPAVESPTVAIPTDGLLAAAIGPLPLTDHDAGGGFQWQPVYCGSVFTYPADCPTPPPPAKEFPPADPMQSAEPFLVYAGTVCAPVGATSAQHAARIRTRLELKEPLAVAQHLWGLSTTDEPAWFQSHSVVVVAGSPVTNIVTGLSLLEQALAECSGLPGMIHAPVSAGAHLSNHFAIDRDSAGIRRTLAGNILVVDRGYSGFGPADEPPSAGGGWMFATGMVRLWRHDEITVPDPHLTMDRATNQMHLLAERSWAMAVDCCLFAVEVTTWEGAY